MTKLSIVSTCALLLVQTAACSIYTVQQRDELQGRGVLTEVEDAFDGAKRIIVSPSYLTKDDSQKGFITKALVGAQWVDKKPNIVTLIVKVRSILSIDAVSFNIDGRQQLFENSRLPQFEGSDSIAYIPVPARTFLATITSDNVALRVYTSKGFIDADFDIAEIEGTPEHSLLGMPARHYLQNFVVALQSAGALK